jgi:hypothetical protein
MATDPEDMLKADQAQDEVRRQLQRCRLMVQNGRQLFMLAQATPQQNQDSVGK